MCVFWNKPKNIPTIAIEFYRRLKISTLNIEKKKPFSLFTLEFVENEARRNKMVVFVCKWETQLLLMDDIWLFVLQQQQQQKSREN